MTAQILITGAPGNVGSEVVCALQQTEVPFRIGAFNPEKAQRVFGKDAEIVKFDFLKSETYAQAFEGIDRMFLVRPPTLSNVKRDITPAIRAAVTAGVKHIVFLSIQGVENNRFVPHHKIEQVVLDSGADFTFLRAGFFMQNLSTTHCSEIRDQNVIALPVGTAKTSFIDVRDIAAAVVCALLEPKHRNKRYTLTGNEALNYDEVVQKLSVTLHRTIRYTHPSTLSFILRQLNYGHKLSYTLIMTMLYTLTRFGNARSVSADVEEILGKPPISFDQFAADYRGAWQPSEAGLT